LSESGVFFISGLAAYASSQLENTRVFSDWLLADAANPESKNTPDSLILPSIALSATVKLSLASVDELQLIRAQQIRASSGKTENTSIVSPLQPHQWHAKNCPLVLDYT